MAKFLYVHNCTTNPILTTEYTEIEASTQQDGSYLQFFYYKPDSSSGLVTLATGAETEEVDVVVCNQKSGAPVNLYLQTGTRLSLKALTNNLSTGYIVLCLLS